MRVTIALALGLSLAAAPHQDAKDAQKAPPTLAAMMPKPGPEMKKLLAMVGTWNVESITVDSPMGPGGKGRGISHVTAGPGSLSILIDYRATSGHMKGYKGYGVVAWDAESKSYKQAWTDNMVPMVMISTGQWEEPNLVMRTESSLMGKPFKGRDTLSGIGTDTFVLVSDMSLDGSPMTKVMTLVHTRAKAGEKKKLAQ